MIEDDEGRESGHIQDNPRPPDLIEVIILWTLLGSWVVLAIVVLTLQLTAALL